MNKELLNTITQTITDNYDEIMCSMFGLRIIEDETLLEPGTLLDPSRNWHDDLEMGEELPGTCAVEIKWNGNPDYLTAAVESALRTASAYPGNQILLITGDSNMRGEDTGEIIIKEAEVIASWNRA